jgi:hypothetical protein
VNINVAAALNRKRKTLNPKPQTSNPKTGSTADIYKPNIISAPQHRHANYKA